VNGTEALQDAARRVRERPAPSVRSVVLPVTHLQSFFLCPRRYLYAHEVGLTEHPVVLELDGAESSAEPVDQSGATAADPRRRGTLAHRLLERVAWTHVGQPSLEAHLRELLWAEGIDPSDVHSRDILESVGRFLKTPFARELAAAGSARVHRELPFLLRVGPDPSGLTFHLKGQIDLLFEDADGGATVVDYKFSAPHPAGLAPYQFQLDCYALAARRFVKDGVRVRTGISFLKADVPAPRLATAGRGDGGLEARLLDGARELVRLQQGGEWPGRPEAECEALACGYRYRCHAH
jgi:hypothetical protein